MRIVCPHCQAVYQVDQVEPDTIFVCHRCDTEFGFGEPPEDAEALKEDSGETEAVESPVAEEGSQPTETVAAGSTEAAAASEPSPDEMADTAPETATAAGEPAPEPIPEEAVTADDAASDTEAGDSSLAEESEPAPAAKAEEETATTAEEEIEEISSEESPEPAPAPEPEEVPEPKPAQETEPEEQQSTSDEPADTVADESIPSDEDHAEEEIEEISSESEPEPEPGEAAPEPEPEPAPTPEPEAEEEAEEEAKPKAKTSKEKPSKDSKKAKKKRIAAPRRISVNIWPWLFGVLLILTGTGLWFTHSIWLDNIWMRSTLINIGIPIPVRDKDWKIVPHSIHAQWITRLDNSHVLVIKGVVKNTLECKLVPPSLRIKLYAKDAPTLVLESRVMPITELPMSITVKRSPYITPPVDRVPVAAKGERNFELVLETLPDRVGDFSLSPVAKN